MCECRHIQIKQMNPTFGCLLARVVSALILLVGIVLGPFRFPPLFHIIQFDPLVDFDQLVSVDAVVKQSVFGV